MYSLPMDGPILDHEGPNGGSMLKKIINIVQKHMGNNFVSAFAVIGGMGLFLHYKELTL